MIVVLIVSAIIAIASVLVKNANTEKESTSDLTTTELSTITESSTEKNEIDRTEWNLMLVNVDNPMPENYEINVKQLDNGQAVDERCYDDLQKMMDDCRSAV